jgi:hypothetical protein
MGVQIARVKASGIETLHVTACPSIGLHRQLPPALKQFLQFLHQPEPGEKVVLPGGLSLG